MIRAPRANGAHEARSILAPVPLFALGLLAAIMLGCGDPHNHTQETAQVPARESTKEAGLPVRAISRAGHDVTPLSKERVGELAKALDPESYRVTQRSGTEPAFCGNLTDNKKAGIYCCVVCGLPLFASSAKFHSGTGWPSFFAPFDPAHVTTKGDSSHGMTRLEINCTRCGAHLGHVFDDGPEPTQLRFCLNSAALKFLDAGAPIPTESRGVEVETAYFAGGCFWGVEHSFQQAPGVIHAESGYMQGRAPNPTYKDVCTDESGHAEAVKVTYDPKTITYRQLLEGFFLMHDPTEFNRQGPDAGTQYRSGVYCATEGQLGEARAFVDELKRSARWKSPVVTEVELAKTFYPAEEYHQDYVEKTGRVCHTGNPWPEVLGMTK
ncbi:MAG: bifunctional methionine sulfoxide reductase B/A protein [Phycisphaerales bacterium]|nr:bifunctional methionine sulfoxide reductase B/A protein [Phycisphaerales bacterium]